MQFLEMLAKSKSLSCMVKQTWVCPWLVIMEWTVELQKMLFYVCSGCFQLQALICFELLHVLATRIDDIISPAPCHDIVEMTLLWNEA